jgi:hypothetical protein
MTLPEAMWIPTFGRVEMLLKRAAQRDIQDLHPSTNRQCWNTQLNRRASQREFQRIAFLAHAVYLRVTILAIPGRVNIATADQHQSIDALQEIECVIVVNVPWSQHGFVATSTPDGFDVKHLHDCRSGCIPTGDVTGSAGSCRHGYQWLTHMFQYCRVRVAAPKRIGLGRLG